VVFPPEFGYGDNEDFLKYFVLSYTKLLCDSPLKDRCGDKPAHLYASFLRRLQGERLDIIIKRFSGYANVLLENEYSTGGDSSTRVFHEFMKDTPVFKEYLTWIRTGQPELLKFVLSFLLYGKKLEYEDPEFDTTAFRGWQQVEEKLRTLTLCTNDVDTLRNIIRVILPPLQVDHLLPKFGPGKVAERGVRDTYDKLHNLRGHPRLEYAFGRERPGRSRDEGFSRRETVDTRGVSVRDSARQKFVPKDITKSRTISMEPNTFMYFQQEVMRWMVNSMEKGLISRFVNLRDQSTSQMAAVHGSLYFSTDTIDLSSASDSVSVELVRRVFPPDYLFFMMATRSSRVELYDGSSIVDVYKFAPMGSAICFPTQCIIFTAVCLYAALAVCSQEDTGVRVIPEKEIRKFIRTRLWKKRSSSSPFTWKLEPPVVYGDDIAVDSRTTDSVISTLDRLGFTVNRSKSFTGSQSFRESCGVFAFEGEDVTPVLFRLPFFKRGSFDAAVYASFIGQINWLGDNLYHHSAAFHLRTLRDYGFRSPLPFVTRREEFGIYTTNKHRYVYERDVRWNADWQVTEVRIQGIEPRPQTLVGRGDLIPIRKLVFNGEALRVVEEIQPETLDAYKLDQWWRSRVFEDVILDNSSTLRIRPQETRLAPRWARCE
jgi:hypothetical protein